MRQIFGDRVYVEGNNGGDSIDLEKYHEDVHDPDSNLVRLEINNCCVRIITASVPVEFITGTLTEAVLRHGGLREAIMALSWKEDFKEKLAAQVVELDNLNQPVKMKYLWWLDTYEEAHLIIKQGHLLRVACTMFPAKRKHIAAEEKTMAAIADDWTLCEECWKGVE